MRVLNLYAGIGGNRKLWTGVEVTAVEVRADIAAVYQHYFPADKVIVADAHEFLLRHFRDFDFIWSSRPCTSHSRANFCASKTASNREPFYPDLDLYQEIIFLRHWFDGKWLVENVIPYYEPLITPTKKIGRHSFWSNFEITDFFAPAGFIQDGTAEYWKRNIGFDLSEHEIKSRKDQIYRNCVHPETGLHLLNCMRNSLKLQVA